MRDEIDRRMAMIPAMLYSTDESGKMLSVSDAWLTKMGHRREEVVGRWSVEFLTEESSKQAVEEVLPQLFRVGRVDNVRYQMVKKNGDVIDVLMCAVLNGDTASSGRVSLAVVTDITALLQTKRALSESEARYRSLVEDQSEMVSLAAPDGELLYVNEAYASFYGRRPQEMIARNLFEFVPARAHASLSEHFQRVCAGREKFENENQVILPSGERRWIAWTNRALADHEGRITAIHSVGRDIQERIDAEQRVQESEARYRFLAENSSDLILLVGEGGKRLYASPASRTLLGYDPDETIALHLREAIHPDDAPRVLPVLAAHPGDTTLTYRMRRKDGRYVWVETTGKTVELANGERQRLIIVRDIEQRMAAEERLRESEARYRLLADNGTDIVFQLDRNLLRQYVSPASRDILGLEPEEMLGVAPASAAHPEDAPRVAMALRAVLRGAPERMTIITRIQHKDGRWIWAEAQIRTLRDPATSEPIGVMGAWRDISARKAMEDELAEANRRLRLLADQDALTGLANRRSFDEALARDWLCAQRERGSVALIMIDVDRFKAYNDCYGHPAGDECLRRIAWAISTAVRCPAYTAARYGGEEFGVVLPRTDEAGALAIAVRIQQAVLHLEIEHRRNDLGFVTISLGIAAIQPDAVNGVQDALVREADRALYVAKSKGRNTAVLASASHVALGSAPSAA